MQKCGHRGLPKVKIYHLQIILRLMIGHQPDRWYKPKKEEDPKLIPETHLRLHLSMKKLIHLKVTLCFLSFKKSDKTLSSLPEIPFCFSLKIIPSCHTLSNAFEISRKTPLTSNQLSKDLCISWVIDKSCLIQSLLAWNQIGLRKSNCFQ